MSKSSNNRSRPSGQRARKMLPLCEEAGGPKARCHFDVQCHAAKYWGTSMHAGRAESNPVAARLARVERSDGSVSTDKTVGFHSRPGAKQTARNANRAVQKAARQRLKRKMLAEAEAID